MKGPSDPIGRDREHPGTTASSLLLQVRAGDSASWRRLVDLYGPLVYRWCRRGGAAADDAGDLVQEVFLAVAAGIARFRRDRPGDSFRGWLRGITRNKLADHWRRWLNQPLAAGGSDAQQRLAQLAAESEEDDDSPAEEGGLYRRALELMRAEYEDRSWQAFWRVAVEGEPADVVARELRMTLNGVYIAKSRILRRLREELGDLLG